MDSLSRSSVGLQSPTRSVRAPCERSSGGDATKGASSVPLSLARREVSWLVSVAFCEIPPFKPAKFELGVMAVEPSLIHGKELHFHLRIFGAVRKEDSPRRREKKNRVSLVFTTGFGDQTRTSRIGSTSKSPVSGKTNA